MTACPPTSFYAWTAACLPALPRLARGAVKLTMRNDRSRGYFMNTERKQMLQPDLCALR